MSSAESIVERRLLAELWTGLAGPEPALNDVAFVGDPGGLPSTYEVGALASAAVAAATLAAAELQAVRQRSRPRRVSVDRSHAGAAFCSERHLQARGWTLPSVWDPLAGDYATRDGFIRLHTNYRYHRDAVLRVLDVPEDRKAVAAAARSWEAGALESAVVEAGGCAAALRSAAEWAAHPQGRAIASEPLVAWEARRADRPLALDPGEQPLSGVRVLDLTRVIAGPVCTRVLAAHGADVLRIDPPGFEEVPLLLSEVTAGKRRAALDLRLGSDRARFEALLERAHVIVHGYRADALAKLGFDQPALRARNPGLIVVTHDAYGWTGPWRERRGFDSLVQMSCGIAYRGREVTGKDVPVPLPAQALDHATGYVLAAAVARALTRALQAQEVCTARSSLARIAALLMSAGDRGSIAGSGLSPDLVQRYCEDAETSFGPVRRVRCPGSIDGVTSGWTRLAGPLGVDPPEFAA